MFGSTNVATDGRPATGEQIRGFGYLHDGAIDTLDTFFGQSTTGTAASGGAGFVFDTPEAKANVIEFVMAMDSELAPVIGQQVTISETNSDNQAVLDRITLLSERAAITAPRPECDLIATGVIDGEKRGAVMIEDGTFDTDKVSEVGVTLQTLIDQARAPGNALTFTCVPNNQGRRIGIDRDADQLLNADEVAGGTDPTSAD